MTGPDETAQTQKLPAFSWMREPSVAAVVAALSAAGGLPRFVGGCVRDAVLDRTIHDIDIATVLLPEQVQDALKAGSIKFISPGFDHGTITAVFPDRLIEVTTLRRDVSTDGRHAEVAYTDDWQADALRRDFTMNALFLSPEGELVDFTGGVADARAGLVRFVGVADDRIREDYLRILRYFRFLAHYGQGEPDAEALDACRVGAPGLETLSGERLAKEFFRMLDAPNPVPAVTLMEETGCLHPFGVGPFGIERLTGLMALSDVSGNDTLLRFMALLSDDTEVFGAAIDRLKLSNAMADRIKAAREGYRPDGPPLNSQLYRNGAGAVLDSALLQLAAGQHDAGLRTVIETARSWRKPDFPVRGQDLLDRGVSPGPRVGEILAEVENWWIDRNFEPGREDCLGQLKRLLP